MAIMTSALEIYEYIDSFAPFDSAMGFDNVGLLVGDMNAKSEKVLLALDITSDVIEEAVKKNVSIIVTHHPIIFNPLKKLTADSLQYKLARNDITVISAHTNLDICNGGVNDTLARIIGLSFDVNTNEDCYLTGEIEKAVNCREFADLICNKIGCKGVRFAEKKGSIKKVTVSCGAGGGNIFAAAAQNSDAFLTGEIKHHEILFARENNIAVYDIGHFRSEDIIIDRLVKIFAERFPGTVFEKAESDSEDISYYIP